VPPVHAALTRDPALVAALGGPKIYDEPPRENVVSLCYAWRNAHCGLFRWARAGARASADATRLVAPGRHREAHVIAARVVAGTRRWPLALTGHRLVNFRFSMADVRRESDGRTYRALVCDSVRSRNPNKAVFRTYPESTKVV
jgi:hypothetical protein